MLENTVSIWHLRKTDLYLAKLSMLIDSIYFSIYVRFFVYFVLYIFSWIVPKAKKNIGKKSQHAPYNLVDQIMRKLILLWMESQKQTMIKVFQTFFSNPIRSDLFFFCTYKVLSHNHIWTHTHMNTLKYCPIYLITWREKIIIQDKNNNIEIIIIMKKRANMLQRME